MPGSRGAWAFWLTTWAFCWSVLLVPVALTLAAALGLRRYCTHGSRAGLGVAWASVALLAALTVAGAASIGVLVVPLVLLLAVAARLTPSG